MVGPVGPVTGALDPAVMSIWFRYRFPGPAAVSGVQVYSTYTMLPSPLMSPYNFNTVPLEPEKFGAAATGGTIPMAKAHNTDTGAPAALGFWNNAVPYAPLPLANVTTVWVAPRSTVKTSFW